MAPRAHGPLARAFLLLAGQWGRAAVVSDGSLGSGAVGHAGNAFTIPGAAGRAAGANLFHSFQKFDLASGESATFTDLRGISRIIARVTGGASSIDGTINADASLVLINPAGMVFLPH